MNTETDQAAVEALMQVKVNATDYACSGWGSPYGASARAILDAIRAGKVPIPGMVTAEVWRAAEAEVERLKAYSEAADKALELACKTRSAAVDVLKIVNIQRDKWMERAEKATAERDRLAGLLRRIRSGIWRLNEDGWRIEGGGGLKPGEIDAALAEVGK